MSADLVKESKVIDYVVSLGLEAVKDRIQTKHESRQVCDRLKAFILRQKKINWNCTREEEIDFGGLIEYIRTNFLEDVQMRLFGNKKERGIARNTIINSAISYSQTHTTLSRERAIWITEKAIDILHEFYKGKVNRELKFIAAQIEETVAEVTAEQTKDIIQAVKSNEEHVIGTLSDKLDNMGSMSFEKNMQRMRNEDIGQVEDTVSNFFNALGSTHILFPNYTYEYESKNRQFYSKPLSREALEKYPPRIVCTGTIQMDGKYLNKFDDNTIDYANRHQLPITLNVVTAKKLLGEIDDPIQHEAENLIGESLTIPPKPFPPASPCSISLNGDVIFDYILLSTEEILDDGTVVMSNQKQKNCPFKIKMYANMKLGEMKYSFNTVEPTNEELLQFLRIESEVDFLEKIVTIERYYKDIISIPKEITVDDFQTISYLSSLIDGKEVTGSWSKLEFSMTLTEELKQRIAEMDDTKFALSYVSSITVFLYGKSYDLPAIRRFDSVVYQDIEHLKKKAEVLDIGDIIKMVFLPGDGVAGTWRDSINNHE